MQQPASSPGPTVESLNIALDAITSAKRDLYLDRPAEALAELTRAYAQLAAAIAAVRLKP